VNVAARFEEATKTYAAGIIVGERTAAEAPHFALLELGAVRPRGKERPEMIFALLGDETFAAQKSFHEWEEAHAAFLAARSEGDASGAEQARARCLRLATGGMADYYRKSAGDFALRA